MGAVGGAASCAVSVLSKIFSPKKPPAFDFDKTPRWSFLARDKAQLGTISADAARLAALLRYRYNIGSYAQLHALAKNWTGEYLMSAVRYGRGLLNFPPKGANTVMPAWGPCEVLITLACYSGYTARDFYTDARKAFWSAEQQGKFPKVNSANSMYYGEMTPAAARVLLSTRYGTPATIVAATRYLELVRFFGAVSIMDADEGPGVVKPWASASPIAGYLAQYDQTVWLRTTLNNGSFPTQLNGDPDAFKTPAGLYSGVVEHRDSNAIECLGQLRLACAFSYMHMMYHWGAPTSGMSLGTDMIASLPSLNANSPVDRLRMPVNPRADARGGQIPSVDVLYSELKAIRDSIGTLFNQARMQALSDRAGRIASLADPQVKAEILMTGKVAPTMALLKAMKPGATQLSPEAQLKLAAARSLQTTDTTTAAAGGAGGIALVAGLGLLALKFLK
jgi:hypothetical protein